MSLFIKMKQRIIFTDQSIIDFCLATKDTNEVHDPAFMGTLGKRVIVPGMFAFASTAGLSAEFLRTRANRIRVIFNTLLSSGDFADLVVERESTNPEKFRLAAINHKDTLSSQEESTFVERTDDHFTPQSEGSVITLPLTGAQITAFGHLTGCPDREVTGLLFSVAYASHALFERISSPATDVEKDIHVLIHGQEKVSPFYHTLEIFLPATFTHLNGLDTIDYRIHFERTRKNRQYIANLQCEQGGKVLYRSVYKLVGIPDSVILRMAKSSL